MRSKFAALSFVVVALSWASSAAAGTLVKYGADTANPPAKRTTQSGDMEMNSAPYKVPDPMRAGIFGLSGSQKSIGTPQLAEVVHVQQGEVTWVGQSGKSQRVRKGDVLFFAARKSNTARDANSYVDHYFLFPAKGEASDKMPDTLLLNPGELEAAKFTPAPDGREHVYLASDDGSRVVAWRAADQGSVSKSTETRYLAVTGGRAVFTEADAKIEVAAGDTLLIPAGSSFKWQGEGLVGVYVSVR